MKPIFADYGKAPKRNMQAHAIPHAHNFYESMRFFAAWLAVEAKNSIDMLCMASSADHGSGCLPGFKLC